ncbi:hypothetical protein FGO68_gene4907 [Halteria grandinella]|uniref:Uncharacterized protein n=1 Tax=Halteria grandinella TaxID=5974 RepID=A0A8J8N9S8_HALGN|nr:hypothetical protein FGO68_gene4907 [Halteria grandinella]
MMLISYQQAARCGCYHYEMICARVGEQLAAHASSSLWSFAYCRSHQFHQTDSSYSYHSNHLHCLMVLGVS